MLCSLNVSNITWVNSSSNNNYNNFVISESNYLLKNSVAAPKSNPTLTLLNEIILNNSNLSDDQLNCNIIRQVNDPDKGSINWFWTVQSKLTNMAPIGHSIKLLGHNTVMPPTHKKTAYKTR